MFGTPSVQIRRAEPRNQIKSVQSRVKAINSRWDAEERELRKKIAQQRMQQLIGLLGLSQSIEPAQV